MPTQPNIHLVPANACLFVTLVKNFFLVDNVEFVDLFFIGTVVQVTPVHEVVHQPPILKEVGVFSSHITLSH